MNTRHRICKWLSRLRRAERHGSPPRIVDNCVAWLRENNALPDPYLERLQTEMNGGVPTKAGSNPEQPKRKTKPRKMVASVKKPRQRTRALNSPTLMVRRKSPRSTK